MATVATSALPVSRRYDFAFLFDVLDGNPNGDPDSGNMPRIDPQSLQGLVTDGCLKRKIRNAISVLAENRPGCELYFQTQDAVYEKRVLNLQHQRAHAAVGAADEKDARKKAENTGKARHWMCENFYDIRAFGAVMTTGVNCGQVRGPVQITFARSLDVIVPLEFSITRKSVTTEDEAKKQSEKDGSITGTMGRKNTIPYALYRCHGFVSPYLARDTGFSDADLELLWSALKGVMWEIDRSASRGLMCTRGLYVFEHDSPLGAAPAQTCSPVSEPPLSAPIRPLAALTIIGRKSQSTRKTCPLALGCTGWLAEGCGGAKPVSAPWRCETMSSDPATTNAVSDDYPPLSALNDLLFCPRRCALHRLEGIWVENMHTQAGTLDHRRAHEPRDAEEVPFRTARAAAGESSAAAGRRGRSGRVSSAAKRRSGREYFEFPLVRSLSLDDRGPACRELVERG